ncbi:MBL fold metallo-hydrolase [Blastococcus sp. TF02A_35]|uniref:MBL fold metallo-hydrolase n=1 Tax=Blastococcus sp. TF02A-35 TaxID=2559612 RepID=UPI0010746702|nr:MBL fold metallo-hydrolase [Blastococcus sp. TF02A_35]TFV47770.1 MBL fold metallo-hydrolase [Blastococcus sp. TF02A_35]
MLTQIAEDVLVHRSELLRNNTVVVLGPAGVLLVDPGLTGGEMACLAADLAGLGLPVVAGFATHPDWDHVLWDAALGAAPRYGTDRCAAVAAAVLQDPDWQARADGMLPPEIAGDVPLDLYGRITGLPAGTARVPWEGPAVRIVEHPAHAPGHAALLVEDRGVLLAGDMLSDVFVPMLDDATGDNDPVADYLVGLERLEAVAGDVDVVVPGHGSVGRGAQVRGRIALDRAYVHALRDRRDPDDPRLGPSAEPGWEWVGDIHAAQAQRLG